MLKRRHVLCVVEPPNQSDSPDRVQIMMTLSNENIFRVTGHLCGEFTGDRWIPHTKPVTRSFDVFFD